MTVMPAPDALLRDLFAAALAAADPALAVPRFLPPPPRGRTIVVGAGKAAASMAAAVEAHWPGPLEGLVVTRYGHAVPCRRIRVVEASHPMPDAAGTAAAEEILGLVRGLGPDDLVLCLVSGGGSALLGLPAPGITLDDKRALTTDLLRSGATIGEINTIRKHLSAIKGGRLAQAAAPARLVALAISDVPNDDPAVIASGLTVPDPTTYADARGVLAKYGITPPPAIAARLAAALDETPKPGDPIFANTRFVMVATPQMALDAAAERARAVGLTPIVLGDAIEGEARDVALVHAAIARQVQRRGQPLPAPAVLLSGGETTVTVRGRGRGGRNAEFLLALAVALDGAPGIHALAGDTDGIDGTEDNAGALLHPDSIQRGRAAGIEARERLADNDGYGFFAGLGDLVRTGPTLTNVNDFRAILVLPVS
ncbi:glycerate 2-kinase [Stella humosa]|uniref:Glycerate 2-kinase n=1 Tax=Stella humosa TaxID=94 RepID=A0A3N1KXS2_9PROT|nr:glycerate kinase [Stella humosa]ROP83098.1 glycerate 2-kinase [Stella humosa]BBK30125.1 hydroxypyruvate reductase [Stella humosa]